MAFGFQPQIDPVFGTQRWLIGEDNAGDDAGYFSASEDFSAELALAGINYPGGFGSVFGRDRSIISPSPAVRRLQLISQVSHPMLLSGVGESRDQGVFDRHQHQTRLSHTMEVARLGERLSDAINAAQPGMCAYYYGVHKDIVISACLAHDIGHPPFGHVTERLLNHLMDDAGGFEGNAQTIRHLTTLSEPSLAVNLSRRTLASCMKYPWPRFATKEKGSNARDDALDTKKFCVYDDLELLKRFPAQERFRSPAYKADPLALEAEIYDQIYFLPPFAQDYSQVISENSNHLAQGIAVKRLMTPEAEIMNFADDVAYVKSDFAEACTFEKSRILKLTKWRDFCDFIATRKNSQMLLKSLRKELETLNLTLNIDAPWQKTLAEALSSRRLNTSQYLDLTIEESTVSWETLFLVHSYLFHHDDVTEPVTARPVSDPENYLPDHIERTLMAAWLDVPYAISLARMGKKLNMDAKDLGLTESDLHALQNEITWLVTIERGPSPRIDRNYYREQNLRIIPPIEKRLSGKGIEWEEADCRIKLFSVAERGRFVSLVMAVAKTIVAVLLHRDGTQKVPQIAGALRCAILFTDMRKAITTTGEYAAKRLKAETYLKRARKILPSWYVDEVENQLEKSELDVENEDDRLKTDLLFSRFCCDFISTLTEPMVGVLFQQLSAEADFRPVYEELVGLGRLCTLLDCERETLEDRGPRSVHNFVFDGCPKRT